MKKRTWLVFCAVQLVGFILGSLARLLGQIGTQDPFVMFPVLAGEVLLLPGIAIAIALDAMLNRAPTYIVLLPTTIACNAVFWFVCSIAWRKLRGKHPV